MFKIYIMYLHILQSTYIMKTIVSTQVREVFGIKMDYEKYIFLIQLQNFSIFSHISLCSLESRTNKQQFS